MSVVKVLYIVPIIISPLLTIIIKRNYIFSLSWSSLTSFAISLLFPMLLMIVCVENQINYWPIEQQKDVLMYISTVKLFVSALFFACIQDNPIFDDLKGLLTVIMTYIIYSDFISSFIFKWNELFVVYY